MNQLSVIVSNRQEEGLASQSNAQIAQSIVNTEPLQVATIHRPTQLYFLSKRFIDISLSLFGIIVLLPVFLIIALCIKLGDGGAVLHFREIIGKNGRRFYALKFRTMIHDADTYLAKHPELMQKFQQNMKLVCDPRVT